MAFEIEEHIRVRAYHLWEANGRPEGRDLEFWEQARQTISLNEPAVRNRRAMPSPTGNSALAKPPKRRSRAAGTRRD
jgi:hypothetical protein